jgi:hypothetical protein
VRHYVEAFDYTLTPSSQPWGLNNGSPYITNNKLYVRPDSFVNKAFTGEAYSFYPQNNYHNNYCLKIKISNAGASYGHEFMLIMYAYSNNMTNGSLRFQGSGFRFGMTGGYGGYFSNSFGLPLFSSSETYYYIFMRVHPTMPQYRQIAYGAKDGSQFFTTDWQTIAPDYPYFQMGSNINWYLPQSSLIAVDSVEVWDELTVEELDALKATGSMSGVTITPGTSNASAPVTVTLSDAANPTNQIYFTVDGSDPIPQSNGALYTVPFTVGSPYTPGTSVTVKAVSYNPDTTATSNIANAVYSFIVPAPVITRSNGSGFESASTSLDLALTHNNVGVVHYAINAVPTEESPIATGDVLSLPYDPSMGTFTLNAVVYLNGAASAITQQSCTFFVNSVAPLVNGNYGTLTSQSDVVVTASIGQDPIPLVYEVYYTLDGSTPTKSSQRYTGSFSLPWAPGAVTVTMLAFVGDVASAFGPLYSIVSFYVDKPVITPGDTKTTSNIQVQITCATAGAVIHYTLDGSAPSQSSPAYTTTLVVGPGSYLRAVGYKLGLAGAEATASYDFEFHSTRPQILNSKSGDMMRAYYMKVQGYQLANPHGLAEAPEITTIDGTIPWLWRGNKSRRTPAYMYAYTGILDAMEFQYAMSGNTVLELGWDCTNQAIVNFLEWMRTTNLDFYVTYNWSSKHQNINTKLYLKRDLDSSFFVLETLIQSYGQEPRTQTIQITDPGSFGDMRIRFDLNAALKTLGIYYGPSTNILLRDTVSLDDDEGFLFHVGFGMLVAGSASPSVLPDMSGNGNPIPFNYVSVVSERFNLLKSASGITMRDFSVRAGLPLDTEIVFDKPLDRTQWYTSVPVSYVIDGWRYDKGCAVEHSNKLGGVVLRSLWYYDSTGSVDQNFGRGVFLRSHGTYLHGDFTVEFDVDMIHSIHVLAVNQLIRFLVQPVSDLDWYASIASNTSTVDWASSIPYPVNDNEGYGVGYYVNKASRITSIGNNIDFSGNQIQLGIDNIKSMRVRVVRSNTDIQCSVLIGNQWHTLQTITDTPNTNYRVCVDLQHNSSMYQAAYQHGLVTVKSIKMTCQTTKTCAASKQILLHGCWFYVDGVVHSWEPVVLDLPASSFGYVVYNKLTRQLQVITTNAYFAQETYVFVGIFKTTETGLVYYTPVLNGSLITCRDVDTATAEPVAGEYIIGCGTNLTRLDGDAVAWDNLGQRVVQSISSLEFQEPRHSYLGHMWFRLIQAIEKHTTAFSFLSQQTQVDQPDTGG